MLAAYASSGLKGENLMGGMGLSHSLGHALGSPYGIPHGITSCMTLGKVVRLKACESPETARQISCPLPLAGGHPTGDDLRDALEVGDRIIALVDSPELYVGGLSARGVSKEEIPSSPGERSQDSWRDHCTISWLRWCKRCSSCR